LQLYSTVFTMPFLCPSIFALKKKFRVVKTGLVNRDTYYKNKKPLWEQPQSG
jgi:hypothetical protein